MLAVDLPGYGKSPKAEVDHDTWLAQLVAAICQRKPVLVSPSMSGRFSLPLVTGKPDALAGFVAVAPVGIPAYEQRLDQITVPTLAIWGEKDRVVPIAHADLLVKKVAGATKVTLKGAQHPCYLDAPDEFHKHLVDFLAGISTKDAEVPSSGAEQDSV